MSTAFETLLKEHAARYPLMRPRDAVKLCCQLEYGGGHLIQDRVASLSRLRAEVQGLVSERTIKEPLFDPIGGGLSRLHLGAFAGDAPTLETINGAFVYSAAQTQGTSEGLEHKLRALEALCSKGDLPFTGPELMDYLAGYRAQGCPMVSHSEAYRVAYAPAYRVVLSEFEALFPLLGTIDRTIKRNGRALVAIDGPAGAGKSRLGALLQDVYQANLYHMDDFFLTPERKTLERLAEPGGNVDHERFLKQVLEPLRAGRAFDYRRYDCQKGELAAPISCAPNRLEIVEGSYSMHPALQNAYDLKVFLDISPELQSARILKRSGEILHRRFLSEWIPLENRYFEACAIKNHCDFVLHR